LTKFIDKRSNIFNIKQIVLKYIQQ
jgi:hypothetical protein